MEMFGKPVSGRMFIDAVPLEVFPGTRDTQAKYLRYADTNGEHVVRMSDDLRPELGIVCRLGLRLVSPEYKHSKYDRKYVCDAIAD